MVDMSHYCNNGRSLFEMGIFDGIIGFHIVKGIERIDRLNFHFKLFGENLYRIFIEKVVFGNHGSECKEYFDHFADTLADFFGEFIYPYIFRYLDNADSLFHIFMSVVFLSLASAPADRTPLLRSECIGLGTPLFLLRSASFVLTFHLFIDIFIAEVQHYHFGIIVDLVTAAKITAYGNIELFTTLSGLRSFLRLLLFRCRRHRVRHTYFFLYRCTFRLSDDRDATAGERFFPGLLFLFGFCFTFGAFGFRSFFRLGFFLFDCTL